MTSTLPRRDLFATDGEEGKESVTDETDERAGVDVETVTSEDSTVLRDNASQSNGGEAFQPHQSAPSAPPIRTPSTPSSEPSGLSYVPSGFKDFQKSMDSLHAGFQHLVGGVGASPIPQLSKETSQSAPSGETKQEIMSKQERGKFKTEFQKE